LPESIRTIFCEKNNILTFISGNKRKTIKPKLKLLVQPAKKGGQVYVTGILVEKNSGKERRNVEKLQGAVAAEIKHLLIECQVVFYKKLKFVGVGYRALLMDKEIEKHFAMKLGLSHLVYCKLNAGLQTFYTKRVPKMTLFGNCSFEQLTQMAAKLRNCKLPEPYKGKGILLWDEKVRLKIGKRV